MTKHRPPHATATDKKHPSGKCPTGAYAPPMSIVRQSKGSICKNPPTGAYAPPMSFTRQSGRGR